MLLWRSASLVCAVHGHVLVASCCKTAAHPHECAPAGLPTWHSWIRRRCWTSGLPGLRKSGVPQQATNVRPQAPVCTLAVHEPGLLVLAAVLRAIGGRPCTWTALPLFSPVSVVAWDIETVLAQRHDTWICSQWHWSGKRGLSQPHQEPSVIAGDCRHALAHPTTPHSHSTEMGSLPSVRESREG